MTREPGSLLFGGKIFPNFSLRRFVGNLFPSKLAKCITSCCNETREEFSCVNLTEIHEERFIEKSTKEKENEELEIKI